MKTLILNLLILFPLMGWTQSSKFWQGFEPEVGIGYSTARWIVEDSQNGISDTTFRRNRGYPNHDVARKAVEKAIHSYNHLRPHKSCDLLTPVQAHKHKGILRKR